MARGSEDLLNTAVIQKIIEALKALDERFFDEYGVRLSVVFVDTLGAAFGLEDENSAAQVNAAMRMLRQIGSELGAVVIPVHHYGKTPTTGLRGSSAFRGAGDAVLSVTAERDELTGRCRARSLGRAKERDGEEGPLGLFALRFVALGMDDDGDVFGSCFVEPGDDGVVERNPNQKITKGA